MSRLPQALVEADRALTAAVGRVVTSQYLNPTNEVAARADFEAGKPVRFTYRPAFWADELLRTLDRIQVPENTLGTLLLESIVETRAMAFALRDRTPAAMVEWARVEGWLDEPVSDEIPTFAVREVEADTCSAREMSAALANALREAGHHDWRVESDLVMSARILVDSLRHTVRVNPRARCTPSELVALIAHEIGVHVRRAVNGTKQPLTIFQHGLPGYLPTEEGLALHAEAAAVGLPARVAERQRTMAKLALRAQEIGFTQLASEFRQATGASGWLFALRVKRGLADPEGVGAYVKDRVYWLGLAAVAKFLRDGGDRQRLMVGKVGLHHPIAQWQAEGWVSAATS